MRQKKSDSTGSASDKKSPSAWERVRTWFGTKQARIVVLSLFAVQSLLLLFVTNFGTPPDESNHWKFINFYANNSLSPIFSEQTPTYNLGDKTREVDYMYHYVMSLVVRILPFSEDVERYIIRLFSLGFAVLSFVFLAKVLRKLHLSETMSTVTILILSQLSMVLMMSSAVNNDTLVWLGMMVGLWLLLEIWERPRVPQVLGLLLLLSYGGLVKRTLLPIAVAILGVAAVLIWQKRQMFWGELKRAVKRPTPLIIVLALLVMLGAGLSTERIGGNLLTYNKIVPTCEDVQGEEACYGFWASIRARELAARPPEPQLALPAFTAHWLWESFKNILDIQTQGWRHEVVPPLWMTPVSLLLVGIGLVFGATYDGRRLRREEGARKRLVVLAICLFYMLFHLLYNFSEYRHIHVLGIALNGRYILAGLFPIVGLAVFYWSALLRKQPVMRTILAVLVIGGLAIWSGLSLLLRNPQLFHS